VYIDTLHVSNNSISNDVPNNKSSVSDECLLCLMSVYRV